MQEVYHTCTTGAIFCEVYNYKFMPKEVLANFCGDSYLKKGQLNPPTTSI